VGLLAKIPTVVVEMALLHVTKAGPLWVPGGSLRPYYTLPEALWIWMKTMWHYTAHHHPRHVLGDYADVYWDTLISWRFRR
jgi:hypothetical protein